MLGTNLYLPNCPFPSHRLPPIFRNPAPYFCRAKSFIPGAFLTMIGLTLSLGTERQFLSRETILLAETVFLDGLRVVIPDFWTMSMRERSL